jgi:hypothetical protein
MKLTCVLGGSIPDGDEVILLALVPGHQKSRDGTLVVEPASDVIPHHSSRVRAGYQVMVPIRGSVQWDGFIADPSPEYNRLATLYAESLGVTLQEMATDITAMSPWDREMGLANHRLPGASAALFPVPGKYAPDIMPVDYAPFLESIGMVPRDPGNVVWGFHGGDYELWVFSHEPVPNEPEHCSVEWLDDWRLKELVSKGQDCDWCTQTPDAVQFLIRDTVAEKWCHGSYRTGLRDTWFEHTGYRLEFAEEDQNRIDTIRQLSGTWLRASIWDALLDDPAALGAEPAYAKKYFSDLSLGIPDAYQRLAADKKSGIRPYTLKSYLTCNKFDAGACLLNSRYTDVWGLDQVIMGLDSDGVPVINDPGIGTDLIRRHTLENFVEGLGRLITPVARVSGNQLNRDAIEHQLLEFQLRDCERRIDDCREDWYGVSTLSVVSVMSSGSVICRASDWMGAVLVKRSNIPSRYRIIPGDKLVWSEVRCNWSLRRCPRD